MAYRVDIVNANDWAAMYIDGEIIFESHNIRIKDIIDAVADEEIILKNYYVTPEYEQKISDELGGFPNNFDEIGLNNLY